MRVLGIDSSLTGCGLCVLDEHFHETRKLKSTTLFNKLKGMERILYIEREIEKWASDCDLVVIEGYAFDSKFNREALAELVGVIKRRLHLMNKPILITQTQKAKKILSGFGNLPKDKKELGTKKWILEETQKNYGIDFEGRDNECDAFGIALVGLSLNLPFDSLNDLEKLVVMEIRNYKPKVKKTLQYYFDLPYKKEIIRVGDMFRLYCPAIDLEIFEKDEESLEKTFEKEKIKRIKELRLKKIKIKTTKKYLNEV